ncbi:MAG: glycosyltransferase [Planctomycetaceae bacterium]|nr:glycosyltransferase [Planctomycetaceae bacterium]
MALTIGAVVPCHNYGRFLAECLDSLLAQSFALSQIVVVLDGCTDDSSEIAARYRNAGVEILTVNVRHPYLARRAGLQAIETDLVFFLDADDRVSEDFAGAAAAIFERRPEVGIVTPVLRTFGETSGSWRPDPDGDIEAENRATSASVVRRIALERTQAFEQLEFVRLANEDYFVWRHLVRHGWKIARSEALHEYRRHRANYSLNYSAETHPWAEEIRRSMPGYRPAKQLTVGWVTPNLCGGGVVVNTMMKMRWAKTVHWAGAMLTDGGASDQPAYLAIRSRCPVVAGTPHPTTNADIPDRRSGVAAAVQLAERCDVVYSWGHRSAEILEAISAVCPVVFGLHGQGPWTEQTAVIAAPYASGFYCVSQAAARCVPVNRRRMAVVIDNGVDLDRIAPVFGREDIRRRWGLSPDDIAVGFVGRISPEKRPEAMVDAVRLLPPSFRPVYITPQANPEACMGSRSTRDLIAAKVAARGGVFEVGDLLGDVYAGLDVLVVTSTEEGGPLVMLEAFAAGVPVVSTPVGLLPSLERQHGPLAIGVPHQASRETLAEAILEATDRTRENQRIRAARELAWRQLSATRMVAEFEDLLWDVAGVPRFRPKYSGGKGVATC